ncbi:molybdopterin-guanine dinucleotide biosynthesis protein B [Ectobacillus panaciterrae]|uniref:molybdopterin-guanine dinucleotide biosynthesis protein B n=1 Tax=Ectobacillus panaciterrae TaxID=363872 RepID=UPI0004224140|nr:molybdopterin-guanine dinucleotide biosynthesis protein B [Ectobacillus panaciterrae]
MGVEPFILQIVGYQNSGKTTVTEKVIRRLSQKGYKVGALKHHGHGGTPDMPGGKDSTRHLEAGAAAAGVEGEGLFLLSVNGDGNWIDIYKQLGVDILIIEGYKRKPYKKIVCIRNEEDTVLLEELTNVIAVISWIPIEHRENVFFVQNEEAYLLWIEEYVKGRKHD